MRCLLVLSMVLACVYARETALKVTWGIPSLISNDFFLEIPRALADVQEDNWELTARPTSPSFLPSLTMYCYPNDVTFCGLFDAVGVLAGLQVAISKKIFTEIPYEMSSVGFFLWSAPDGDEYWVNQQYFVSAETEAAGITVAATETLREGAVWVVGEDGNLMRIGATKADAIKDERFYEQGCLATMGLHYYYGLYPEATCEKMYPWFDLFLDDDLVGTGLGVLGKFAGAAEGKRLWFEVPTVPVVKMIVSKGPQCLFDLAGSLGLTTIHIFYGDRQPSSITCPST